MAIKQLINKDGIPFEVVNPKSNNDMLEALEKLEYAKRHPEKYKVYHIINDKYDKYYKNCRALHIEPDWQQFRLFFI